MNIDYRTIFESVSGVCLILDPKFNIVAMTDGYLKATHTTRDIIGKNLFEVFPERAMEPGASDATALRESLELVLRTKKTHNMGLLRYDIKDESGKWRESYWLPVNKPVLDAKGEILYIMNDVEDVTKSILNQERFKLLVDGVKEYAIFMLDKNGYIMTWNDGAERINGYKEEEVVGKHFSIFYTKQDLDAKKPQNELKVAAATGYYEEEGWRLRKDGSRFWSNVLITALYDDAGKIRGFGKVTRDMTEKRKTSLQLTAQANRFYNILEQAHSAVISMNEQGVVTFWNKMATKMFEYTADEMIGNKLNGKIIPKEFLPSHINGLERFRKTRDGAVFDKKLTLSAIKKNGDEFPVDIVVTKGKEPDGSYIFTAFIQDITDRVEKQRIAILNESLRKLNEELELFAYVTSHDLQDPLRTMNAYIKLLSKKFPNPDAADYLDIIVQSNTKMQNLVANLLQYARDSGQTLNVRRTNIKDVVDEAISSLENFVKENEATITVGPMPIIACDAIQIGQVFHNLIHNAIKYRHPKRKPEVKVSYEETKKEHIFTISDNGIGIKNDDVSRLFVLFRRIRKDDKGVGFGLAVCKKIMEHHEGRIWADSILDEGSNFYFAVPKYLSTGGGYI